MDTNDLNNYTRPLYEAKKEKLADGRGCKQKVWVYSPEYVSYLKSKKTLNFGEFHKAYADLIGFGYQKAFKIVKEHKEYLQKKNLIIVKPGKKINQKTNKGNNLEMIYVQQKNAHELAEWLEFLF